MLALLWVGLAHASPPATAEQRQWVDTVIRQHHDRLRRCLIEGLLVDDRLAGVLSLRAELGADGHITEVQVQTSSLGAPTVEACVAAELQGIDFSRAEAHPPFHFGHTLVFFPDDYPTARQLAGRRNLALVEDCVAAAGEDHELRGLLQVRFMARAGRLAAPELVLDTVGHVELAECVEAGLDRWRVPRSLSGRYDVLLRVTPEQGVTPQGLR